MTSFSLYLISGLLYFDRLSTYLGYTKTCTNHTCEKYNESYVEAKHTLCEMFCMGIDAFYNFSYIFHPLALSDGSKRILNYFVSLLINSPEITYPVHNWPQLSQSIRDRLLLRFARDVLVLIDTLELIRPTVSPNFLEQKFSC